MSFSIGSSGAGMGPRGALNRFGNEKEGRAFDRRVVRRMLAYLRPHRGKMLLALLLVVITTALSLTIPYLIGVAIDDYIAAGDLPGLTRISLLIAAIYGALFATTAARAICSPGRVNVCWPPCGANFSAICRRCRSAITTRISSA